MKNVIICCDGTNNQLEGDLTNVVRMFEVAVKDERQMALYDPGVGTMASPDKRTWIGKRWSLVKGLAFAQGFDENVFEAYRFLMSNYEEGDRVFLFGFSRGAFTIRVLAGMLHGVGLLHRDTENLLPYLWRHYLGIRGISEYLSDQERDEIERHEEETARLRKSFTRPCPIAFMGPWDTVGSVGMYNAHQSFPYTYENPQVEIVRHAVSAEERRAGFRSNVFKDDQVKLANGRPRVMNVWFPGFHSDIGGGHTFADSGLAMGAFMWMLREAEDAGMHVDKDRVEALVEGCQPSAIAKIHDSLKGAWKAVEYVPALRYNWEKQKSGWRYKPNKARTTAVSSAYLHQSLIDRMREIPEYRPASLGSASIEELLEKFTIES